MRSQQGHAGGGQQYLNGKTHRQTPARGNLRYRPHGRGASLPKVVHLSYQTSKLPPRGVRIIVAGCVPVKCWVDTLADGRNQRGALLLLRPDEEEARMLRQLVTAVVVALLLGGGSSVISDEPVVVPVLHANDEDACDVNPGPQCDDGTSTGTTPAQPRETGHTCRESCESGTTTPSSETGEDGGHGTISEDCKQRGTCFQAPVPVPECIICFRITR